MPRAIAETSTPAPSLAPPPLSRRGLMAGATTAALAGAAMVTAAHAEPPGDDAELLRLAAEFEAVTRRHNGLWQWRVWGQGGCLQGVNYIEDDDDREAAAGKFERRLDTLLDSMLEHPPTTLAGCQALARCLVLSASNVRDVVCGEVEEFDGISFSQSEWGMVVSLLHGLTGGTITDANCMDVPASFVPDVVGAA